MAVERAVLAKDHRDEIGHQATGAGSDDGRQRVRADEGVKHLKAIFAEMRRLVHGDCIIGRWEVGSQCRTT